MRIYKNLIEMFLIDDLASHIKKSICDESYEIEVDETDITSLVVSKIFEDINRSERSDEISYQSSVARDLEIVRQNLINPIRKN